jgi:hypothetical protein
MDLGPTTARSASFLIQIKTIVAAEKETIKFIRPSLTAWPQGRKTMQNWTLMQLLAIAPACRDRNSVSARRLVRSFRLSKASAACVLIKFDFF